MTKYWLSPKVSQVLGVSQRTLRRMVDSGDIRPIEKLPGKTGPYLYDPSEVEQLAEARRNSARSRKAAS